MYEYATEKDIEELYDLQLRAFESEAEMIGSRNIPALTQEKVFELYTCTKSYININLYEKIGYRTYKVD